jgi:hypothetical protein
MRGWYRLSPLELLEEEFHACRAACSVALFQRFFYEVVAGGVEALRPPALAIVLLDSFGIRVSSGRTRRAASP